MKHTPGPWTFQRGAAHPDYDGDPYQIVGADGLYIGKADAVTGREYFEEKNYANARLIKEAPALLEIVRILAEDPDNAFRYNFTPLAHDAAKLLARIEGE